MFRGSLSLQRQISFRLRSFSTGGLDVLDQPPAILVYGGNGALGRSIVSRFAAAGWDTISVDHSENRACKINVTLDSKDWCVQTGTVLKTLESLESNLCVVANAAGGWSGGDIRDQNLLSSADTMWDMNVRSALAASHIASHCMNPGGLLVLTGAAPVLRSGTPGMIAYGVAKASVHHIVRSLAEEDNGLPEDSKVIGILPITIDTAMNRKFNPDADYSTWTPAVEFAQHILNWAEGSDVPVQGGMYVFETKDGQTTVTRESHED